MSHFPRPSLTVTPSLLPESNGSPRPRPDPRPSILEELARRFSPGPFCRTGALGAADPMVQVDVWETDGGAVLGPGIPAIAAGVGARERDGAHMVIPAQGTAAADGADVGSDLVVTVVTVPGGNRIEIVVRGELDLQTVPALRAAVTGACRAQGERGRAVVLVLNLAQVTFMDSAALHALADIDAAVAVAGQGYSLRVTPPTAGGPRRLLLLAARRRWLPRRLTGLTAAPGSTAHIATRARLAGATTRSR